MSKAQIATNEDRRLSTWIGSVRWSVKDNGGNDEQVFACMASILVEFRNETSAEWLGKQIAEHG